MNLPIIIDTDPGIDDALAIAFSYSAKLPVKAISTVYGNSTIENVSRNADFLLDSLGTKWPIHAGASAPLHGKPHLAESHGKTGLGNVVFSNPSASNISSKPADQGLIEILENNEDVILFCLGPLTNIATLFMKRPDLVSKIHQLIIMGGAFYEKGNVTEWGEFNCYNDPAAFQMVVNNACQEKIDTIIIPVEVCRKITLTPTDAELMRKRGMLPEVDKIVEPFINYYIKNERHGGFDGAVLYDVLVPLYYQSPELFTVRPINVSVQQDGPKKGLTTAHDDPASPLQLCTDVQASKAKERVMQVLA